MHDDRQQPPAAGAVGWKISTAVMAVLLIVSLAVQVIGNRGAGADEAVAYVNGKAITKDELFEELFAYNGGIVLDDLVRREVIRQGIGEAGTTASDGEVRERLMKYAEPYGSVDSFIEQLGYYGYTEEQIREQLAIEIAIEKIVGADVTVTDEEIGAYFGEYRDGFDTPETVRASHILVATREEAESLLARLEAGEDFAALAAEHSLDEATKDSGGDVGEFARGEMDEAFEETAFGLEIGGTAIVGTSYGFHVVRVTEKTPAREATLESARDEIEEYLKAMKLAERVDTWIADREAEAEIEYLLE